MADAEAPPAAGTQPTIADASGGLSLPPAPEQAQRAEGAGDADSASPVSPISPAAGADAADAVSPAAVRSGSLPLLFGDGIAPELANSPYNDQLAAARKYRLVHSVRKDVCLGARRQQLTLMKVLTKKQELPEDPPEPELPAIVQPLPRKPKPKVLPKVTPKKAPEEAQVFTPVAAPERKSLAYRDPNDEGGDNAGIGSFKGFNFFQSSAGRSAKPPESPKFEPRQPVKQVPEPAKVLPISTPPEDKLRKAKLSRKVVPVPLEVQSSEEVEIQSKPKQQSKKAVHKGPKKDEPPKWLLRLNDDLQDFEVGHRYDAAKKVVSRMSKIDKFAPVFSGSLVNVVVNDRNLKVRQTSAKALIALGSDIAGQYTPSFVHVLRHDKDPGARKLAVKLIGAFGHAAAHSSSLCFAAIMDSDRDVRAAAGTLLATLQEVTHFHAKQVAALLSGESAASAGGAPGAGSEYGGDTAMMSSSGGFGGKVSSTAFGNWCATGFTIEAIEAGASAVVRLRCAELLCKLGHTAVEPHVQALMDAALYDRAAAVREAASRTLNIFGDEAPFPFEETIGERLKQGDAETRKAAALALGLIPSRPAASALLAAAIDDDDDLVRWRCAKSLGLLGDQDSVAVASQVEELFTLAVGELHDEDEEAELRKEEEVENALELADAILGGGISPKASKARQGSRQGSEQGSDRGSRAASSTIREKRGARATEEPPSPRKRQRAIDALGGMGSAVIPHLGVLVKGLKDRDPSVREGAARVMGVLGDIASEQASELIAALGDSEAGVRCGAAEALGSMGASALKHVPTLGSYLHDEDRAVQRAVASALGYMGEAAAPHTEPLVANAFDVDTPAQRRFLARAQSEGTVLPVV